MRILAGLLICLLAVPVMAEPLTLAEAQREALQHSHQIKRQDSKVRQAAGRIDEVYSGVNPHLNFKAGTSYLTPTVSFATPQGNLPITESGNYNVGLSLEQAIYTFGRLKWSAEAAELARTAAELELENQKEDTLSAITQAYLDLVFGQRAVDVAEMQLATRSSHLDEARLRVKAGTIPPFEVLSFETALAQAKQRLLLARKDRELAKTRVLLMIGRKPHEDLEVEQMADVGEVQETSDQAVQRALHDLPGLQAFRTAVEAAKAKVNYEKSQSNPTLGFRTSYVRQNSTAFQPNQMWVAGIELSVPLYDGGATKAKTEQAKEEVVQLQETLAETEQNVVLQVEQLHLDLVTSIEQLKVADAALVQANEQLRLAQLRYKVGVSTNLELLQAETSQAEASLSVHQSHYNVLKSYYAWKRATALPLEVKAEAPTSAPAGEQDQDPAALLKEGAVLIDVRTDEEYEAGHIKGALHIPHQRIGEVSGQEGVDKDTPILLYCKSGRRAQMATDELQKQGYTKVHNIGGYEALKEKGLPSEVKSTPSQDQP